MRGVFFTSFILALGFFIVLVPRSLFAEDNFVVQIEENEKNATAAVDMKQVRYELPYPGILSDNPLYFLKAIRDRLIGSLISDPLKKSEYLLLTSDKRFHATIFLVDKDKDELALSTVSKGNNYFNEAIGKLIQARKEKKLTDPLLNKMIAAGKKHVEVLSDLSKKVDKSTARGFEVEEQRARKMNTTLETIQQSSASSPTKNQ